MLALAANAVVMRDETETRELVELGWNEVCPPESAQRLADSILGARGRLGREAELYGNGKASRCIVRVLDNTYGVG